MDTSLQFSPHTSIHHAPYIRGLMCDVMESDDDCEGMKAGMTPRAGKESFTNLQSPRLSALASISYEFPK